MFALKKTFYSSPEFSQDLPDEEKRGGRGHGVARSLFADESRWDSILGVIRVKVELELKEGLHSEAVNPCSS